MDTEINDSAPAESAIGRAQAGLVMTREKAIAVQRELQEAIIAVGALVLRAAAGEDVPEEEWRASEDKAERLGRLATRYATILTLQAKVIDAVKAENESAGAVIQ
jgi:hypothetical protein